MAIETREDVIVDYVKLCNEVLNNTRIILRDANGKITESLPIFPSIRAIEVLTQPRPKDVKTETV